jgi:ATP-dependent helicase/nuclease subunit A
VTSNGELPFGEAPPTPPGVGAGDLRDGPARRGAVDPAQNVVLEASAGTGKTRVLVDRYLNLLRAGVDPRNVLAMTFTRKAAAEMRQRIVDELRKAARLSPADAARWRGLRDRLNEIGISTIDAFCLSLLREFPLEADLDPGFDVAAETEVPRLVEESLDQTLRICRARARTDEDVALLFAQLGETRLRAGLAALLERRVVAGGVLRRITQQGPRDLTIAQACRRGVEGLAGVLQSIPGGLEAFLDAGPIHHPRYMMLARDLRHIAGGEARDGAAAALDPALIRGVLDRLRAHFFTKAGTPRKRSNDYRTEDFAATVARTAHWKLVTGAAPAVDNAIRALRRDLNAILSRGVWQVFSIATDRYHRTLEAHGVLDFSELLVRAQALLGNMDEFARSRYLLEARYHHVLVDEFQDTSRAQWDLVALLVRTWGEGLGLSSDAPLRPSIFIVGDRKQSIYGFRDAEVAVLDEAASAVGDLRPGENPLRNISHSFRSVPPLLAFANDLFLEVAETARRPDAFRYDDRDAFPIEGAGAEAADDPVLGVVAADGVRRCAEAVAGEIARLAAGSQVRDRQTGVRRPILPGDIAILFRSREGHREFEQALEARRIPTYVYKGLGFFDAEEVKDIAALLRYLAEPSSDLRAAALLRSRFVRLSDPGIQRLAPSIAKRLTGRQAPGSAAALDAEDAGVLARLRASLVEWLELADRVTPAELLDRVLADSAYLFEIRGARVVQARENVKKMRALVRRIQNRGYLTLARLAGYLDRLSAGDESNAVVDAIDAVNLMTVHAAKGLEFPVVFVVNLSRGSGGRAAPIRVAVHVPPEEAVAVGDFQSEFDEDATERDREETKRLLYVAFTRARDRLYLTSVTERGAFRPRSGSLGEVLPRTLHEVISTAAAVTADGITLEWCAASGRRHRFRVCGPSVTWAADGAAPFAIGRGIEPVTAASGAADDFGALDDAGASARVAVTGIGVSADSHGRGGSAAGDHARVVLGRVVHRLFQNLARGDAPRASLVAAAQRLVTDDEIPAIEDLAALSGDAADVFVRMWTTPEVRSVLEGAECLYEVPVSFTLAGARPGGQADTLRGVIDCLVQRPNGEVVVLDFKTGTPRRSDRQQLDAYVQAARMLLPGASVDGRLVYPPRA